MYRPINGNMPFFKEALSDSNLAEVTLIQVMWHAMWLTMCVESSPSMLSLSTGLDSY